MKQFKKWMAVFAAGAMLLGMAGCGNKTAGGQNNGETSGDGQNASGEKKTLVLGTSADYPPFEFHILKDGVDTIVGLDVSLAQQIADDMGAELVIKDIGFDNLCTELAQGSVDIVIAAMEKDDERDKVVDFSDGYYTDVPPLIITMANAADQYTSLDDFNGKTVGAQTATTKAAFVADSMTGAQSLLLSSVNELINSLVNGKCDAVVLDGAVAQKYASTNSDLKVLDNIALGDSSVEPYRVAVQEGDPDGLLTSINATIAKIVADDSITKWSEDADTLSSQAIGQ